VLIEKNQQTSCFFLCFPLFSALFITVAADNKSIIVAVPPPLSHHPQTLSVKREATT